MPCGSSAAKLQYQWTLVDTNDARGRNEKASIGRQFCGSGENVSIDSYLFAMGERGNCDKGEPGMLRWPVRSRVSCSEMHVMPRRPMGHGDSAPRFRSIHEDSSVKHAQCPRRDPPRILLLCFCGAGMFPGLQSICYCMQGYAPCI
jgi:hypothetical protein